MCRQVNTRERPGQDLLAGAAPVNGNPNVRNNIVNTNTNTTTNAQPGQPQLPNVKTAYDTLFSQIQARAFFGRLGQLGYSPTSEKQAQEYLNLAGKLRVIEQDPQVKAANDANDPIAQASAALDTAMARFGLDTGVKTAAAQEADVSRRNIAAQLAADPSLYASVLSLKSAEASQLAAQIGYQPQAA